MMKHVLVACVALLACVALAPAVQAQSLDLEYCVEDLGGGVYNYEFRCTTDQGWQPGMGWRWYIWGDCRGPCSSPLTNFVGDPNDLPVGPWTQYSSSGGGHNGPTFAPVLNYWIPQTAEEELTWSGTSTADLPQGQLLFSTIAGTIGGAVPADYKVATRVECGGGKTCVYEITKSKGKQGCRTCPNRGDRIETQTPCEEVEECRKKIKTTIECLEGPGICKIKAKRTSCE